MSIFNKTVVQLFSELSLIVKSNGWDCLHSTKAIERRHNMTSSFLSTPTYRSLPEKEQSIFRAKLHQAMSMLEHYLRDSKAPVWKLYDMGIGFDFSQWNPRPALPNHAPRFVHIYSGIIFECDWRDSLLRTREARYRFYLEKDKQPLKPYILETDSRKMAAHYLNRIEQTHYGNSLDCVREVVSLITPVICSQYDQLKGRIYLLDYGENVFMELSEVLVLVEEKGDIASFLSQEYSPDTDGALALMRDLLTDNLQ